jgi:uncharacterized membrane protein
MNAPILLAVAVIGFSSGLRALTGIAVVSWASFLGYLDLSATSFAFIASPIAVGILTILAIVEYVGDKLPGTPARTALPGLIARIVTGTFAAACLLSASGQSLAFSIIGALAAIAGAFAGFQARTRAVRALGVNDSYVAVTEDLVTLGIAILGIALV